MEKPTLSQETATALAVVIIGAVGSNILEQKAKRREKRYWERPHLGVKQRRLHGQHNLLREMRFSDNESFSSIMRLCPKSFEKLLSIVGPKITHYSNRAPIHPYIRLAVTLRYLATGESKKSLSYTYRLGISTTHYVIIETLSVIYNLLKPLVLPEPTKEMWLEIAAGFHSRWNVPNCCGALDGKHIRITRPSYSGSEFWCFKNYFSVVLMGISDSKYKFIAADVGSQGRNNDVIVLYDSKIGQQMKSNTFNLPGEKEIMHGPKLPHFFLGDEIFGLQTYLMVPYPGRGTGKLSYTQKIFNYRQARGRRTIENTFGIFAAVWRIFNTEINAEPPLVDMIVMAAVCLHNFRIMENEPQDEFIQPENHLEKNQSLRLDSISNCTSNPTSTQAQLLRDELAQYFILGGHVPWQHSLIHY